MYYGNTSFVVMHALQLHCWVHTKVCTFFTVFDLCSESEDQRCFSHLIIIEGH